MKTICILMLLSATAFAQTQPAPNWYKPHQRTRDTVKVARNDTITSVWKSDSINVTKLSKDNWMYVMFQNTTTADTIKMSLCSTWADTTRPPMYILTPGTSVSEAIHLVSWVKFISCKSSGSSSRRVLLIH